jgi:Zn-dependent M28 family amino/carboxypeptidase
VRRHPLAAALFVVGVLAACSSPPAQPAKPVVPVRLADDLAAKVTVDGMLGQLQQLQQIADANGGSRADGTPGYEASVDYIAKTLKDKGFDVQTPQFERLVPVTPGKPALSVGGRNYSVDQASLLLQTPAGGITGPVVKPPKPAGCVAGDYGAAPPRGGVAVADDTSCSIVDKQNAAVAVGAAALIVVSAGGRNGSPAGLFVPSYYQNLKIPVAIVGTDGGAALRRATAPVKLVLDNKTVQVTSRNVLAQTKSGSTQNVVMVGAHLDSAAGTAGINDNGSGVAAELETALALGPSPDATNAVRFAFWGAEEQGIGGSLDYVFGLSRDELNQIALYLNFDMIGSPNAGFFTYDGDQSGPAGPDVKPDDVPIGSAGIERTLAGYLNLAGKRPADMSLAAGTDYSPFLTAGVPIGGMTTGSAQQKTNAQARLWGGRAGAAFDPNYRTPRDNLGAINRDALAVMGPGVAFAVGIYAASIDGVNGVPAQDKRHRAGMKP